ncbi:uracil phosphoribosyltransferase [Rhodopirellula sp. MGV]|uniref:uracil phosphoribosyltransferase n=1 Tax=Rhodopirellula sp. MGV TaxID=2023130 RepID=UPI000B95CE6B|nr:uracil phosphoribosyltransferase [Rhodopirellula sp. MGV]OYP32393.1 uracil phosphoribosyltransferase [Rhodopirellula sp. MGV]PNY35946.1 uracil phosphoribosyltransferase [Rhodopirellula baltica]
MSLVHRVEHPLIEHHLCTIRDKETRPSEFRAAVQRLSMIIGVYATQDLSTKPRLVKTPICDTTGECLSVHIGIVPILRAGLGMVDPILELLPEAAVWHLGLYRNEETAEPVGYYDKLPHENAPNVALVVDPMLATGGSIDLVIRRLRQWGVSEIRVLSLIASKPGIDRVQQDFPDVKIYVAAIDPELNEQSYIVPGLGDAGDRIFDTPQHG